MGSFIVVARMPGESVEGVQDRCSRALEVFQQKELRLDARLVRDGFVAFRYRKLFARHESLLEFDNGDFIFATGTFIYDGATGRQALSRFFSDRSAGRPTEKKTAGNFTLVIYADATLRVMSDYCGYHPVYHHQPSGAVSNSFLALARMSPQRRLHPQALHEYLLHGFFAGRETLLDGIEVLDSDRLWQVMPSSGSSAREPAFDPLPDSPEFAALVEAVSAEFADYFSQLAGAFPDRIGSALSGGYDSRHMTALLSGTGVPRYLYVYGGRSSSDVRVALQIAAGEGFEVEHVDKSTFPRVGPDEFAARVERDFYFFDGIKPVGLLDDGSDMATRLQRAQYAQLQLNGAGGEIYREIWNIGDRSIDLRTFLRLRFDRGAYDFLRAPFDDHEYFAAFGAKVRSVLRIERDYITRREGEMLFPFLRNRFARSNNLSNAQISDSLLPFMETRFVFPSFDIPIRYKYAGQFHAALIRAASPAIARYGSDYGINFSDPVPLAYQVRRWIERGIPPAARLLARRSKPGKPLARPYYLGEEFVSRLVKLESMAMSEFVDFSAIDDPELYSRAVSVELLLRDKVG
ncbi:MAG: hypothetical protein FJ197_08895 [Gammaproteobacteria bacterium]|nr:hypothetical protein [Gammaproteobacteria bacterium]